MKFRYIHRYDRQMFGCHSYFVAVIVLSGWMTTIDGQSIDFPDQPAQFLSTYCYDCHDGSDEQRINLSQAIDDWQQPANFRAIVSAFDRVKPGEMPPADADQPLAAERQSFINEAGRALNGHSRELQRKNGRVELRRLAPTEYEYALNDLFGIQAKLKDMIPSGSNSNAFDTVASHQGFTALHASKYLEAAEKAIDDAIQLDKNPKNIKKSPA